MKKANGRKYLTRVTDIVTELDAHVAEWGKLINPVSNADGALAAKTMVDKIINIIDFEDWSSFRDDAVLLGLYCGNMISEEENLSRAVVGKSALDMIKEYQTAVLSKVTIMHVLYDNGQMRMWNDALLVTLAMALHKQGIEIKKCRIRDKSKRDEKQHFVAEYGLVMNDIVTIFRDISDNVFNSMPIEENLVALDSQSDGLNNFISHALRVLQEVDPEDIF